MHEASLVGALLAQLRRERDRAAAAHPGAVVREVHVRIGALAGVEPDLFRSAFDLLKADGGAPEATLHLTVEAEAWRCPLCGGGASPGARLRCPTCDVGLVLAAGGELFLDRLELEVDDV
jgi:hydrogenase nickel incorporation protein HypA/HybF